MKTFKRASTWLLIIQKRYFSKPLFLLILLMIPLLTYASLFIPSGEESFLTVAMACEDMTDEEAVSMLRHIEGESNAAVRYYLCSGEEEVLEDIKSGKARIGFLLPALYRELFSDFAKAPEKEGGRMSILGSFLGNQLSSSLDSEPIQVIAGSNDLVLKLGKEDIYGKIYPMLERAILKSWMDQHAGGFYMNKDERDAFLDEAMDLYMSDDNLFELTYMDEKNMDDESGSFLLSPLRGMLAVLMLLAGCAAAILTMQDIDEGRFVWVKKYRRCLIAYAGILIPVADCAVFVLAALYAAGSFEGWSRELPSIGLYALCAAGFCSVLRVILRTGNRLAALLPVIILASLFLTPVFARITVFEPLQAALPTWFYLSSIHNGGSFTQMAAYAAITAAGSIMADLFLSQES